MPRAIGANCRLLMIPEATYGTAPAGDWQRMPFLSCDLGAEQPLLDADVIGVGPGRQSAADLARRALKLSYPLFGDPDYDVYSAFGFRRIGGVLQQSGTIVIDRDGIVRLAHRMANPAGALPMQQVRRALGTP